MIEELDKLGAQLAADIREKKGPAKWVAIGFAGVILTLGAVVYMLASLV